MLTSKIQTTRGTRFFNTFETGWQCVNKMYEAETEEDANLRYTIRVSDQGILYNQINSYNF